jgi:hypothetical protein
MAVGTCAGANQSKPLSWDSWHQTNALEVTASQCRPDRPAAAEFSRDAAQSAAIATKR